MKQIKNFMLLSIITFSALLSGCNCNKPIQEEPPVWEFKIVNVGGYIETQTNNFGGVVRQYKMLSFTFLDSNGQAITKTRQLDNTNIYMSTDGNSKIIQQEDKITMYLTEEMMNKIY